MADVNIPDLTELTTSPERDDKFEIYDDSASQNKFLQESTRWKYDQDEVLLRVASLWETMVYDNGNWDRNANGVLIDADVKWSVFIEGATDGRFTGTADSTFFTKLKTVLLSYPDRSVNVTFTGTWQADGTFEPSTPTVA